MSRKISVPENEILLIQIKSILKHMNSRKPPLLVRAVVRFHEEFLGSGLREKCRFALQALTWAYQKLTIQISWLVEGRRLRVNDPHLMRPGEDHKRATLQRLTSRFKQEFLQGDLGSKFTFIRACCAWPLRKASKKLESVALRKGVSNRPESFINVAVEIKGGVGDYIIVSNLIRALYAQTLKCNIDIFPDRFEQGKSVYANMRYIRNILPSHALPALAGNYDLILKGTCTFVNYDIRNRKKIHSLDPKFLETLNRGKERQADASVFLANDPWLGGLYARLAVLEGRNRYETLGYFASLDVDRSTEYDLCPDLSAYDVFNDCIRRSHPRYITIHDGYDIYGGALSARATKQWPIDHWNHFVELFKKANPEIGVAQVGSKNSKRIANVDVQLIGRTDLHQAAWVIKRSLLHVDTCSGLVHLAKAMRTKCVVLFGPTSRDFFAYDRNINITSEECSNCWWIVPDWLARCPRGLPEPACMRSILPEIVLNKVNEHIESVVDRECSMIAAELYSKRLINEKADILQDLFHQLDLPVAPITAHSKNDESGLYLHASKQWEYLFVLDQSQRYFGEPSRGLRIADLGGGRGALAAYLAKLGHEVEVFDTDFLWDNNGDATIEKRYMEWAKRNLYSAKYGSLFNVPAEDEVFDAVSCVSVFEHVSYKEFALKEAFRILRPGGLLTLTFDIGLSSERLEDSCRTEIFNPELLQKTLRAFSITERVFEEGDIARSSEAIHLDNVAGIPYGMTVGGISFVKS